MIVVSPFALNPPGYILQMYFGHVYIYRFEVLKLWTILSNILTKMFNYFLHNYKVVYNNNKTLGDWKKLLAAYTIMLGNMLSQILRQIFLLQNKKYIIYRM